MSSYSADRVDVEDAEEGLEGEDEAGDGDLEGGGFSFLWLHTS